MRKGDLIKWLILCKQKFWVLDGNKNIKEVQVIIVMCAYIGEYCKINTCTQTLATHVAVKDQLRKHQQIVLCVPVQFVCQRRSVSYGICNE